MERFNALGRGAQIMLVAGVLLFISLFFNWQEVDFDLGPLGEGSAGVSAWNNFMGVVLGLLTIVLLAWLVVRVAAVNIPLPVSQAMTAALLGTLIMFFAILKNLVDDYSTIWSYIGVVLAILVAVGAWQTVQEAGGIDTLKSEVPRSSTSSESYTSAPAASSPPPPPPAAPESEAAPAPAESPPMSEPEPYEPPSDDPDTRRDA